MKRMKMSVHEELRNIENLMKCVADLEEMCDVILIAGDDMEKFPAHRLILTAASKYFHALLGPNFLVGTEKNILLKHIDGPTLKIILDFIYTGHIEITGDNVDAVIAAASSMELIAIEEICGKFWVANLSNENCVDIYLSADKYNLMDLRSKALNFISKNFEAVPIIRQIDDQNFEKIIKHDKITAAETIVLDRLVEWINRNESKSVKVVADLLKSIRLECIPNKMLIKIIGPLYKKYDCIDIVLNEFGKRLLDPKTICLHRYAPMAVYYAFQKSSSEMNIQKYDSYNNKWSDYKTVSLGSLRSNVGLIFVNKKLFVIGGLIASTNQYSISVESHNLDDLAKTILPNMAISRSNFTPIPLGKYIYVFGGKNANRIDACERFDTEERVKTIQKIPNPAYNYVIEQINGQIYIAGGANGSGNFSKHLYCYYPDTNSWSEKSCIAYQEQSTPALAKTNQFLYAMERNGAVHQYDTERDLWTTMGSFDNTLSITRTLNHYDQMYAMCKDGQFVILNIEEGNTIVHLDALPIPATNSVHLLSEMVL